MSPSLLNNSSLSDIRLRDEYVNQTTKHHSNAWEDQILQATKACEAWKSEADESNRKVCVDRRIYLQIREFVENSKTIMYCDLLNLKATEAKQQRDEALNHVQLLTDKLEQVSNGQNGSIPIPKDLRGLSIQKLKTLQVSVVWWADAVFCFEFFTECI